MPILLTVMTNPQTRVLVQSPETDRPTLDLGDTPIDGKSGTRVGDTVVLANPAVCIRHEETIQFGEAGKVKIIEKVFGSGKLNMSVTPELEGLAIWCGSLRLGPPGTLELYEGKHRLELRGGALRAPVEFVVTIEPNRTTTVARPIDLSTYLQK